MKRLFRKGFALLLAALLLIGVVPVTASITASADEMTLSTDENGERYLNMSESGSHTLDLTDNPNGFYFTLYDVGGAN